MLQLRAHIDGSERVFPLRGEEMRIGRGSDNELRLTDPSVSRHHAVLERDAMGWVVRDLESTNGTQLNDVTVTRSAIAPGDRLRIGAFDLVVEPEGTTTPAEGPRDVESTPEGAPRDVRDRRSGSPPPMPTKVPNATIVRPLEAFSAAYGLGGEDDDGGSPSSESSSAAAEAGSDDHPVLDDAWGNRVFGHLTRLARLLLTADTVPAVLSRVMDLVFEALPVERGFILLADEPVVWSDVAGGRVDRSDAASDAVVCELARFGDETVHRPDRSEVPVSSTILDAVMGDRVALLTYDAMTDGRLVDGDSIRLHGIRAAMSVPLWSGRRIMGVFQVDSSVQVGAFRTRDLDFLTAIANYVAVAVERLRNAERAETERRLRSRLERYHSPAVIDEMVREPDTGGLRQLKTAEVTVLFIDLVGFTAFSESASPQDVAEILESYFNAAVEAIFAAGGTLDKFIGDAVMAFFGAPLAQEDHAERAVRAALDVRRAVAGKNRERGADHLPKFDVRIAINSGPVVVGDVGTDRRVDYTVLGNTVNVAARLEQFVAAPGDIVIGPETRRLLGDSFRLESLGKQSLKGLQQKIRAWQVLDPERDETAAADDAEDADDDTSPTLTDPAPEPGGEAEKAEKVPAAEA